MEYPRKNEYVREGEEGAADAKMARRKQHITNGGTVWKLSGIEALIAAMPPYNGFLCGCSFKPRTFPRPTFRVL